MKNTKEQGKFTLFVYPEKPNYFIGVCLEFDLIEEGETVQETLKTIWEASDFYLETIIKKNWSDELLNELAPEEYWEKYRNYLKKEIKESSKKEDKRECYWNFAIQQVFYPLKDIKQKVDA